jgi:uncharacterized membrane protein
MAAPHVAGAWAILKQKNPTATVGQVLNALQTTGIKITDTRQGANNRVHCRIQIDQALNNIPEPVVTIPIAESIAYGINNCGQIVGTQYVAGNNPGAKGFITDTTMNSFTLFSYNGPVEDATTVVEDTYAYSIDNTGRVSGTFCCNNGVPWWGARGFWRSADGNYSLSIYPNSKISHAYGNNDSGATVGFAWSDEWPDNIYYVWQGNGTTIVSDTDFPRDINNRGRYVGYFDADSIGPYIGFYTDGIGNRQVFSYPGSSNTFINGINESGQMVGYYDTGPNCQVCSAFVLNPDGTASTIQIPGAAGTVAWGLNDSGQIVGHYWTVDNVRHGFVDLRW